MSKQVPITDRWASDTEFFGGKPAPKKIEKKKPVKKTK